MQPARLVLWLFLVAQAWDGIFTYAAVYAHGIAVEGNPLLGAWMTLAGPLPAIVSAKTIAAGAGVVLYVRGVHRTLALLTALYGLCAITPWLYIFGQG